MSANFKALKQAFQNVIWWVEGRKLNKGIDSLLTHTEAHACSEISTARLAGMKLVEWEE